MNCTIWRSTSMSAPFSASSVNAIVAVVIVDISLDHGWWVAPQPYPGPRWPPRPGSPSPRGKPLRATPYAPCRNEGLTPLPGTSTAIHERNDTLQLERLASAQFPSAVPGQIQGQEGKT